MFAPKTRSVELAGSCGSAATGSAGAGICGGYIDGITGIRTAILHDANVGGRRGTGEHHGNVLVPAAAAAIFFGVINRLRNESVLNGWAHCECVALPFPSVTELTLAVLLVQPTATTFRSPADCAAMNVTGTLVCDVCGVAELPCT